MESDAVQLLREIRDEARLTNARLDQTNVRLDRLAEGLDQTNVRLDQTNVRLDQVLTRVEVIETTIVELAEQQRFVVRYLKTLSDRDGRLEDDVVELRRRVEKIEHRLDPG